MKAKALEHSISMQRHKALSQHITELRGEIEEMKKELGLSQDLEPEDRLCIKDPNQIDRISEFTQTGYGRERLMKETNTKKVLHWNDD
uniref:CRM-domain containing factor CFM3, chloroplastic/mitochondrial-like n=1 Tax=Cicer arietinum TaxID=3827 RepID=A0A3Q7XSY5_CICAR|nr:CRM-domain containing factor CFM3, chloroplastic/mitochondrial-like [Cicer arietinum]